MTVLHKFASLRASHDLAIRLSAFYVAVFLIVGTYMSFLPLWLQAKGLSATQIALIYAIPVLLRPVFTTLLSFFADRSGRHVWVLKMLAAGALCSVLILPLGDGFALIFIGYTLFALFWTTVVPLTDAVALTAARRGAVDYGRIRLWGSLSYIAVTLAGGVAVELFGAAAALWLFIGSAACVLLAAQWLPEMAAVNGTSAAPLRVIRFADLTALIRLPVLWLFLAATSAVQATHAVYYLFGTIHWISIGISPTVVGMLGGHRRHRRDRAVRLWRTGDAADQAGAAHRHRRAGGDPTLDADQPRCAAACAVRAAAHARPDLRRDVSGGNEFHAAGLPRQPGRDGAGAVCLVLGGRGDGQRLSRRRSALWTFGAGAYLSMAVIGALAVALRSSSHGAGMEDCFFIPKARTKAAG